MDHEVIYNKLKAYTRANGIELTEANFDATLKLALTEEEYKLCYLPDTIAGQIDQYAMRGDVLMEEGKIAEAVALYEKGYKIIPEPKEAYEASLWFLVAIGDAYWYNKNWDKALPYFEQSLGVKGGTDNPFVFLRKGQLLYELGDEEGAYEALKQGFDWEGAELFEDEDAKYLKLATSEK